MKRFFGLPILYYLRFFAKLALKKHNPRIIGITGSVGKTSARNAVYAVLQDYFKTKMIKKGNSESGIPLGILGLAPINYSFFDWVRLIILAPFGINYLKGIACLIVEMGVDEPESPKNMDYLLTIVKPEIAILLNVHPVHIMQFKTIERIAAEKVKIISKNSNCEIGIYNNDNFYTKLEIAKLKNKRLSGFGKEKNNDLSYGDYEVSLQGTKFDFLYKNEKIRLSIKNYVLPKEYFEAFSSAVLVGKHLGLSGRRIADSLSKNFILPKSRGSIFQGVKNTVIIDSSYNASRVSVLAYLGLATELKKKTKRPFALLFGDMRELGEEEKREHEEIARHLVEVDRLFLVGPLTKKFILPKFKQAKWFDNSISAGIYLKENLAKDSLLLVKGSQNTIFLEEAIKPLLKNKSDEKKLCRQSDFWFKKKGI